VERIRIDFPERVLHTEDVPVRITNLKYGNHLGHDKLVSMLHEARVAFLRAHGMEELDIDGLGIILVDLAVSYRREAFYGQVLSIDVAAGEVGSRGAELLYRVRDRASGEIIAMARTGLLFYDYAAKRVGTTPERFRSIMA
jgi:acyl-CoA thioester hydrolase